MLNNLTLRWRMTMMSALLITFCCMGLTFVLNKSAYQLADSIEAVATIPAEMTDEGQETSPLPMLPLEPAESTTNALQGYKFESLLYMIFAVLIGSGLTYYVAGKALKPVETLNNQVKNLKVNELHKKLEVPSINDEISELTISFNEMTEKLHEAFSMQQRFSANAAHELRTPLAIMQAKIDVFHKKALHTDEEYIILIDAIQKQTTRLRDIIKTILDMTNQEDAEMQIISLRDIFDTITQEIDGLAKQKNICISLLCKEEKIIGNPDLMHQAFFNIIENAVKYNTSGGRVDILVSENKKHDVSITIQDTGIGIPDEMKKLIFEPFYRVDKSRSREMGGSGLGLTLVESIIKNANGKIDIKDNEPQGTIFSIIFETEKNKVNN